jgi:transcriptional regulator with XRE-family HTH domain
MASRIARGRPRRPTFIRDWRQHRGLTQKQLADQLKTSTASISRLEKSDQPYGQETLEAIADALNCEPQDLIARKPGTDALGSLWEQAIPDDRKTISELAQIVLNRRMSLREEDMRRTVRLGVAEHIAEVCMALLLISQTYSEAQVEEIIRGIVNRYAKDTWTEIDPASSDMFSAEAEDAVRSLLAAALDRRATLQRSQTRRAGMPRAPSKKPDRERVS